MTPDPWPPAVPFDPESGSAARLWEAFLPPADDGTAALLLVSGEAARYSGWGVQAAVALAEGLATSRPVLLIDLHLDDPQIDPVGVGRDADGIADVILFGASTERVAVDPPGRSFRLVPTGPPVPDAEAVLRDPSWTRVIDRVRQRGSTVLLFAPWRARGLDALIRRTDGAVFLGGQADVKIAAGYMPPELKVLGVAAPPLGRRPAAGVRTELQADVSPADRAAGETSADEPMAVAAPGALSAATSEVRLFVPPAAAVEPPPPQPPRRRLRGALIPILILVFAGIAALALLLARGRDETGGPPVAATPARPQPADAGEPVGPHAAYSVAIEAHADLATAMGRVAELREAEPSLGFFVAPILVDSVLYHRVMAGPVADTAEAAALQAVLLERGHKTGATDWDIRLTPLAFLIDRFDSRDAAEARATVLALRGIPSYILSVSYSGGATRHHLYSGAYAGPAEAEPMRQLLEQAGVEAPLVQRMGRIVS
jgi:hypothetical protein